MFHHVHELLKRSAFALLFTPICFTVACNPAIGKFSPSVEFSPQIWNIDTLPDAFPPINCEEIKTDWGKEVLIGKSFAREFDFYRAITAYKRALILLNECFDNPRRHQIEYSIVLCYYLAQKYQDAVEYYEESSLSCIPCDFPAYNELLIILYECYTRNHCFDKGLRVLQIMDARDHDLASRLQVYETLNAGEIESAQIVAATLMEEGKVEEGDKVNMFLCNYFYEAKSVRKAATLNALLPGAGYYYVGQKNAALTSLLINALFIAATWRFFEKGDIAAGIITLSLETGWYFGGIHGAAMAAKQYNEHIYSKKAKEFFFKEHYFPIVSFSVAF